MSWPAPTSINTLPTRRKRTIFIQEELGPLLPFSDEVLTYSRSAGFCVAIYFYNLDGWRTPTLGYLPSVPEYWWPLPPDPENEDAG